MTYIYLPRHHTHWNSAHSLAHPGMEQRGTLILAEKKNSQRLLLENENNFIFVKQSMLERSMLAAQSERSMDKTNNTLHLLARISSANKTTAIR